MWLEFAQLPPGEHGIGDPISVEPARPRDRLVQALLSAETIEPASVVHNALSRSAGLGNQRVMLVNASRHQRGERLRRAFDASGRRGLPIAEEPRGEARQG